MPRQPRIHDFQRPRILPTLHRQLHALPMQRQVVGIELEQRREFFEARCASGNILVHGVENTSGRPARITGCAPCKSLLSSVMAASADDFSLPAWAYLDPEFLAL